ncbi:MAG TPA: SAF domain-containing protein [Acidimicrobiales bacterium]
MEVAVPAHDSLFLVAARARMAMARRPVLRAAAVAALAVAAAGITHSETNAARTARRAWGSTAPVLVATAALTPGDALDATNAAVQEWPVALVPPGAASDLPLGTRVAHPIAAGQAVHPAQLSEGAGAGLVPAGRRVVAVGLGRVPLPVQPGDHVDLLGGGAVLAAGAPVVSVALDSGEGVALVAVRDTELTAVAAAVSVGDVVLAAAP